MNEFNNRIDAQRSILRSVNLMAGDEELFGLSSKAIERWVSVNRIHPASNLVTLVRAAAAELFFLANKSQEQVTDEYQLRAKRVALLGGAIDAAARSADLLPKNSGQESR